LQRGGHVPISRSQGRLARRPVPHWPDPTASRSKRRTSFS